MVGQENKVPEGAVAAIQFGVKMGITPAADVRAGLCQSKCTGW